MPISKAIERKIKAKSGGEIVQVYGPYVFLDGTANEVWIKKNGEFDTTYVFYNGEGYEIFENFEALSIFTRDRHDKINRSLSSKMAQLSKENDNLKSRKPFTYTAIFFIVAILLFLIAWLFYGKTETYHSYIFSLIGGLLATACYAVFGKFKVPNLPFLPK